jgi:type III secretion system FlhB-like substrate exporter
MNGELEVVEFILEQLYETNYKVFAFVNKDDEIALVHEDYYDY